MPKHELQHSGAGGMKYTKLLNGLISKGICSVKKVLFLGGVSDILLSIPFRNCDPIIAHCYSPVCVGRTFLVSVIRSWAGK